MVEHEGPVKVSGEVSVEGGVNDPSILGLKISSSQNGDTEDRTSVSEINVLHALRSYRYIK